VIFKYFVVQIQKEVSSDLKRETQGCYSKTGIHIGMDRNFVCL
jgi:hypothetical protein